MRAYESVGCDCDPKSTCEGGMHDGSDEACCGTNGGYCGVEWRGTDGAEWIDIHDDACSGTDFFRVSPGCGIEVKTEWGEAYTYNEGSVLVCGYECECRATPGCDTVRYVRIFATGPAAYDQGDEDECEGDEDDDDDWDEDEDEDEECDIETSGDRSSSPSGTTNHGAGNGWCYSDLDEHVGCAASPGDCWAMCLGYYGDGLVAIDWGDGGDCYCQHDCECMEGVGDIGSYLITRDSRVGALPHECGPDEDEDTSAPTTETAVPSATVPTPAPTASPTSEPTFHTWAPTPVPACCVEQQFDATGDVVGTSCYHGRSPWEESTMADLCTAGHSDAGAMAPPFRDCSQAAMDAGSCGGDPAVYDMRAAMRKFKFRGAFTARWR